MSRYVFKLPDLGEGTVEAEIVGWRVKPGDTVAEDEVVVEVMTEKAAVEVPAPVSGRVISTTGGPGDMVPVGAELIVLETDEGGAAVSAPAKTASVTTVSAPAAAVAGAAAPAAAPARGGAAGANGGTAPTAAATTAGSMRVATSPAIRRRAHEAGIDLHQIAGSGPNGRIVSKDLEAYVARRTQPTPLRSGPKPVPAAPVPATRPAAPTAATEEIKVIGLRRVIAQRMSEAKRTIPHFAYVEELDITELESLRRQLNRKLPEGAAPLTYLPFLALALIRVLRDYPQCNAHYDAERGVIVRYAAVHLGVATQTPEGLKVPVVHDAQALTLWELAAAMRRVSEAARTNKAKREELTGSSITITSLGKLGGIASTPIINAPEVAIIGVNRAIERAVVIDAAIAIRLTMNLSSSFDHRFVDGYDAASMIQALKECLEHPATIFIP
ncbi:MAG TPA: dihydrolipoamide acetyltransferase family protein [Steroidobacteraceae bacterium]|jgi:2-oxoisovalerate dehydrogenase E2 component (dihydrolipoyl transacylase)|nr:dihydrolipoamide acetyltransferase family protein [Steroidobacteraceae bacterium]